MKAYGGVEVEIHAPATLPICAVDPIARLDVLEETFFAPFGAPITIPPLSAAWSILTTLKISVM